jgi:signal transduction histidine kinase
VALGIRKHPPSILVYLGAAVAITAAAFLAFTWYAASRENVSSLKSQQDIGQFVTDDLFGDLSGKLNLMLYYQEAFDKSVIRRDKKWVEWNFGAYQDSTGINASIMFDKTGTITQLYQHALPKPLTTQAILASAQMANLLTAMRAAPRDQPPKLPRGIVIIAGSTYFAVGGRITPEDKTQLTKYTDKDTYVVFLIHADAQRYQALSTTFGISGIEIALGPVAGKAFIPLFDAAQHNVTNLWWTPDRPGDDFLRIVWPLSLLVLAGLVIAQGFVVVRWQALQKRLYQVESMAEAAAEESRAKSAFLGVLSHELRTPLNAIIGFSEMVYSQVFGPLGSPKYADCVSLILQGGKNMLRIVVDLLHIAELETNAVEIASEPTDVIAMLKKTIESLRAQTKEKNVSVILLSNGQADWSGQAAWSRYGGSDLISIFTHLIENAIKFSKNGDEVRVNVAHEGAEVIITVSDQGIGISEDNLEKLGRAFTQVEGHLSRNNGGLGVGLAIAKHLLKLMGGSFAIESELGKGAVVTVRIPSTPSPETSGIVVPLDAVAA